MLKTLPNIGTGDLGKVHAAAGALILLSISPQESEKASEYIYVLMSRGHAVLVHLEKLMRSIWSPW